MAEFNALKVVELHSACVHMLHPFRALGLD